MDLDVPTDLINKAQIGFREAAGLPLFDREHTTLPSIPTVEATISTLDPSPPHLRCKYCHGKLLRGVQSLICIYCGEYQRNDRNPDPISFNSTHGYSWLLQSLNFNGSERIGSLADGSGINGGQSPAEDELTLSELLDLKLIWRDVPKKSQINFHINNSEHSSSLNLGSTDFDSFFTESKRAAIVSDIPEEQPVASKNDLNQAFEVQENLTSVTSSIDEHDDASFGWNAEFQSADVKMENEKPKSTELFVGAEADLSAQMDEVFGPMEGFSNKKPNDNLDPFQDDLFANMKSASFQQAVQLDSVVQAKDNLSGHRNDVNSKDLDGDLFSDGHWQKNSAENTLAKPSDDLDPFQDDLFADMKSASFQQAEQLDSVVQAKDNLSGHQNDVNSKDLDGDWFSDGNWQKNSAKNTLSKPNDDLEPFQDDLFANMKSASFQQAEQLDSVVQAKDNLSGHLNDINPKDLDGDWFSDGNWQKNSPENTLGKPNDSSIDWFENTKQQDSSTTGKTGTIEDNNLFDSKPQVDLIMSEKSDLDNSDKHHSDTTTDWFQDSQWVTGGSSSTTNMMANNGDDDGFDEWNDFTSSTENQASWKGNSNEKIGTSEKISDLNLFPSTADPQEVDFGNFSQPNIFSGDKTPNDTRVAHDIFSEVSTASRNANDVAGNSAKGTKNDEITPNATAGPKNDVHMLLSQMHDLSFMLKSELSIPSKADDLGPSHS